MNSKKYFEKLPEKLRLSSYMASGEYAWSKQDAILVIDYLDKLDLSICGIEVWLPTDPGPTIPTPFIYTLDIEPKRNEGWSEFRKRANHETLNYINMFHWDQNDLEHHNLIPYFNFSICSRKDFGDRAQSK